LGDEGEDGMIILKQILKKMGVRMWAGFICLRMSTSGGICEHGNEPSGFMRGRKFIDNLNEYWPLQKDLSL
jgi:hypothetical protein